MKYQGYSAEDFASDSFFIQWVTRPDEESDWFWQSFIRENPASRAKIEEAKKLVSVFEFPEYSCPETEMERIKNRLLMAVHAEKEAARDSVSVLSSGFVHRNYRWLQFAAAIILIPLIGAGVFFFVLQNSAGSQQYVSAKDSNALVKRISPNGQKSVLFLADGTKVWLNAGSEIAYAGDFLNSETRDIYLEGEAFFDVAHNKDKPFIVHTSSMKVKVLGTSFNVKSYADEKTIETTLVRGKVRIEPLDKQGSRMADIELKPNQRAVFDKESKVINIKEVVAENSASWRRERTVFDEESIDNVISQMERWYDIKIHVANRGALDCKLTATIGNESLVEILKLLEASHDIHYRIEGSDVFIDGTFCKNKTK